MTVVAKTNHENASHWYKLESVGVPMWRSVFMLQLSAFLNSFFFRGFFFSFLLVSAFGGKMIIMIGKDVLKIFFNLVASKEYYKIK